MDSNTIAASMGSALHDLDFVLNKLFPSSYKSRRIQSQLNKLKIFLLISPRNLDNRQLHDSSLPSFFQRIEDTVHKLAEKFHHPDAEPQTTLDESEAHEIQTNIESLLGEIDEWYFTLRDSVLLQLIGSVLIIDDISKIFTSILELLLPEDQIYTEGIEALVEQVRFLQTLICFVGYNPTPQLLAHAKDVAIRTHLHFMCPRALHGTPDEETLDDEERLDELLLKWVQTIKPRNDPRVSEIYIQALITSKLSRLSLVSADQHIDDGGFIASKNFLDCLIDHLWELLQANNVTEALLSVKDHMQALYPNLRSLRTVLKQNQQLLPDNIKSDIAFLLYDAGVLIYSLYQTDTEVDLGYFHDVLKTFKTVLLQLGDKDTPVPEFNFPKTNQLGFFDFVLEKLVDLRSREAVPVTNNKQVQTVHEELVSLRSFLGDILEFHQEDEELQALRNCVLEVAYKVERLIDHLLVGELPVSSPTSVDAIMNDIRAIKPKIEVKRTEIGGQRQQNRSKEATIKSITYNHLPSQTIYNEVVGFVDDVDLIKDRLKRGSKQLKVIAIVGMPGLGKTTLASKVYNDNSISLHFQVRAWCPVSQTLDKKNVLVQLLKQADPNCGFSELNEQDLVERLWRRLKGKRYLILLDDIWDAEAWNSLAPAFPDDNYGSRILLTSRRQGVAPGHVLDQEPHFLQLLNENESLELFQQKLLPEKDGSLDPAFHNLVMQFVAYCKGLPLTIILIAGTLATTKPEDWVKIWEDLSSGGASVIEHCMDSLELSYKRLPDELKPCLLYLGAFREDVEIPADRLLYLWTAEGFVRETEGKRKSKDEQFLHLVKGYDELLAFNEPRSLRRLCIHSEGKHFVQSKLFCPGARSLLLQDPHRSDQALGTASFSIRIFKLLRVLDLEDIRMRSEFPSEISLLVQLVFLAVRGDFRCIPSSIAKLSYLETLIVDPNENWISLPDSLWNLQKLKYFCVSSGVGIVPTENLDNSTSLYELNVFSGAFIPNDCSLERLMTKFPNICKLKCFIGCDGVVPNFLTQLESVAFYDSVDLSWGLNPTVPFKFSFPENLKKLKLGGFELSWENLSTIGKLQNLQVFTLSNTELEGEKWEMKDGEFSQLRVLKLFHVMKLVRWTACDDQLECLQKLELRWCENLEEMPCNCLENIQTLETIVAYYCSETTRKLVEQIEEQQVEQWGNLNLKIKID
ncbi:OLC1v1014064C1 [Oldenlandia corymbosa var. corymbosa]|uniref:OLC1v1014064C1 n=1 Tax=Oldenlandia corymbosa var. corymbosa TaxID=529605 RepID=A0AAV1E3E4_OLDCO|nr:OLC1v1014064C1 [Oldenlandia corymbosa var. corymbosa]